MHDLHTVFAAKRVDDLELELCTLGRLVHRGVIVARDPLAGDGAPFAERFPAGSHRVEALIAHRNGDERVALARVVFADGVPHSFELALRAGEDARMLSPGQLFGYGVDAGTGCFATPDASDANDGEHMLAELDHHRRLTWSWAAMEPRDTGHEMIAFSSGYGDGVYASYIARAADGTALCLVTHFNCIDLLLPPTIDDPPFRRAYATRSYRRMKDAVADLGTERHGDAYVAASDLVGSAQDAEHLADELVAELCGATGELARDLYVFVVDRLASAAAIQRALAPRLATLDRELLDRLHVTPEQLAPQLFAAVEALWSRGEVALRRWFLELGLHARQLADEQRGSLLRHATLGLHDPRLVDRALAVLDQHVALGGALSPELLAEIRATGERALELGAKQRAFTTLKRSGVDLTAELAARDPLTRLVAARVLERDHASQQVFVAIAKDRTLDLELRREAAHYIEDDALKVAAFTELALAGDDQAAGSLRWVMTAGAIHALERLSHEANASSVRTIAASVLERRLDIDRMARQQSVHDLGDR